MSEAKPVSVAVLHTTPATIPLLKRKIAEELPEAAVVNFLDDSILPMLREDPGCIGECFEKLLCMAKFAERQNCAAVLCACSSVGEFCEFARGSLRAPLVRIDDAVTDEIGRQGKRVLALATLETTLGPSAALLRKKCAPDAEVDALCLTEAYKRNLAGDKAGHDRLIAETIEREGAGYDCIFLAQASMSDAAGLVSPGLRGRIHTSIGPAVAELARIVRKKQ